MLGYEDAHCAVSRAQFGAAENDVPILMDNVGCRGREEALDHCNFNGWGNTAECNHMEDAGVICHDRKQEKKAINTTCIACMVYKYSHCEY